MQQIKTTLLRLKWGAHALVSLYISILSGIIVALLYNPAEPFFSTLTIELVVPYGSFWRGLHYYSSQFFFILLMFHITAVIWDNRHDYGRLQWIRLLCTFPAALLLLFTGYILRGDSTGGSAGMIAENITLSIPLIGGTVNDLLFAISGNGLKKVYAQHLIGLGVIGGYFGWNHLRRYQARLLYHLPVTGLIFLCSILQAAPLEPEQPGTILIAGPWFFRGLQELLRYFPPFWAGICFPLFFLATLFFLPAAGRSRRVCISIIGIWLCLYLIASIVSFYRI